MNKKYAPLITFFALFFTLLAVGGSALALELSYPTLPGGATITSSSKLPQYLNYFFVLATAAAGLLGVISLAIAGFGFFKSIGNPAAASEAKDRIRGSLLGIILLLLSFILLRSINPQL